MDWFRGQRTPRPRLLCATLERMETRSSIRIWVVVLVVACSPWQAAAQPVGPDVLIAELFSPISFGSSGGISAFSVGTDACNIGDHVLWWYGSSIRSFYRFGLYRCYL